MWRLKVFGQVAALACGSAGLRIPVVQLMEEQSWQDGVCSEKPEPETHTPVAENYSRPRHQHLPNQYHC